MKMFEQIVGNEEIKRYLHRLVEKKIIANSLLFSGPDGIGKSLFAQAFAMRILYGPEQASFSHHPDLHIYRPEGKIGMHSIDSMRQFCEDVYLAPYKAKWKVFIIHDADRMLPSSANTLLKTFEEPAPDSVIILLSNAPEALLPTVLSRCRTIRFQALTEKEITQVLHNHLQLDAHQAKEIAALADGSVGSALHLLEKGGTLLREKVLSLLAKGRVATFNELAQFIREVDEAVDESKKEEEEHVRKALFKGKKDDLTAVQVAAFEKEIDGAIAMRSLHHGQAIFDWILAWHRDMHLLHVNGNPSFLVHRDYRLQLEQALQRGEMLPLEHVQKALSDALISLERSTPLQMCLERFLLQLNLL